MKRPKVSLENYKNVYDYYKHHRQGRRAARFLHGALGIVFRPDIHFADGAKEVVQAHFDAGRTFVLAANHAQAVDPCVIAAMPSHEPVFKPLVGNAFIPSKKSIQAIPGVRHLVDGLGAVPVFREQDVKPQDTKTLLSGAARGLLTTAIARMDDGQHMALFPEGTRNFEKPAKIQELQKGIGRMICRVTQIEQPAILPLGIYYDKPGIPGQLTPTVFVGAPSVERFEKAQDVMAWLPDQLQTCVDNAIQRTQR